MTRIASGGACKCCAAQPGWLAGWLAGWFVGWLGCLLVSDIGVDGIRWHGTAGVGFLLLASWLDRWVI